jgi:hypothetical protein
MFSLGQKMSSVTLNQKIQLLLPFQELTETVPLLLEYFENRNVSFLAAYFSKILNGDED